MKHSEPRLPFPSNPHSLWYGVVQDMKHSELCLSFISNPRSLWYGVVQDMKRSETCLSFTPDPHSLWNGMVQDMKHGEPCLSFTSNPHSLWYNVVQGMKHSEPCLSVTQTHTACGMVWYRTRRVNLQPAQPRCLSGEASTSAEADTRVIPSPLATLAILDVALKLILYKLYSQSQC